MTNSKMVSDYFEWLCSFIEDNNKNRISYNELLHYLFDTEFVYILDMDENRAYDGVELRYRFGRENRISEPIIACELDIRPCSILEMMIALSLRIENNIMDNPDVGNQTSKWFWMMINNLGLSNMNYYNFDERHVDHVLKIFLDRRYDRNGRGGLVHLQNPRQDLRNVEIWYQWMWYLSENYL